MLGLKQLGKTLCATPFAPPARAPVRQFARQLASSSDGGSSSKSKSELLHSLHDISDEEIVNKVANGTISQYRLEQELKFAVDSGLDPDCERAVRIRRIWLEQKMKGAGKLNNSTDPSPLEIDERESSRGLPYTSFDFNNFYQQVLGKNCENVIGYVPIPVGFVGPLKLNGDERFVPLATTEGALLASTNRGCRAISESGGANAVVYNDGMTRAPVLKFGSAAEAASMKAWLEEDANLALVRDAFQSTTRFGKLKRVQAVVAGRHLFLRFICSTGDAMGMNMISKGCLKALDVLKEHYPNFDLLALSGNVCTDKKPSAMNWIEGRGKSVVVEVTLTEEVIRDVLKCSVDSLVEVNVSKNLVGSSVAGSVGGNNAHASNIVTALFLATGQDPAQNVESSNCMTLMESVDNGKALHVSVTMPIMEVGTVGGGTGLSAQWACLQMLGVAGANAEEPGKNARELAKIVGATVLAGEISLMSALASNHLVSAHMSLNR